ncbi:YdcF family protein [Falsochrobactrum sp. TDYN1]|uniref:YdcF family protein n=1 Tax=Falsochrobactrum tianjinense TaxID=2706015 RepID=A0A949PK91_9HYPH|nr:YdcF family protein [Falsochrobactrum sp. TDYN1]MBV2141933.1 YdcF family protein [Falsochrobactrum sp. TDYN1]
MTAFFASSNRSARIIGKFPAYRRNAGYDSKVVLLSGKQGISDKRQEDGYAVANKRTQTVPPMADAARHRRRLALAPSGVPSVLGKFIWSVIMRVFRRLQPVSIFLFVALIAFLIGFLAFGEKVTSMQSPALDEAADAIVVLTGGQSRIKAALDLLKEKHGKRLLISGVNPSTNERALQRATNTEPGLFDCCVDLDRSALNTVGNATQSERWIRANGYRRVIVVTNNYHIPRSILEMSHRMQDVEFIPYPVTNGEKREHSWVSEGDTLRVLFIEYVKYLGAAIRVGWASAFDNSG